MYSYRISVFEVLWKNQVIRFLLIFLAAKMNKGMLIIKLMAQNKTTKVIFAAFLFFVAFKTKKPDKRPKP